MSNQHDLSTVAWRKSSYSGGEGGNCVEVAEGLLGAVPVRDSKNPTGPALVFDLPAWWSFLSAVKDGGLPTG